MGDETSAVIAPFDIRRVMAALPHRFPMLLVDRVEELVVGEKIVAMGGVPTVERNPVKQTQDLLELLNIALEFESKAVKVYTEALALAEGDRALVVFLENILDDEQEGVDNLTRILRDPKAVSASLGASKVG